MITIEVDLDGSQIERLGDLERGCLSGVVPTHSCTHSFKYLDCEPTGIELTSPVFNWGWHAFGVGGNEEVSE